MDWALWYLKVRLWKFDGTVSEKMPRITVEALIEQLRGELKALGISHREAEQLAGICRRKLDEGAEQRFLIFDLLRILEGVGIEPADFFARAFRKGELSLVAFGKEKPAQWPRRRRPILNALAKVEERGSRGFLEIRDELRRIEHLRDEDPAAAEKAAWNLLKTEKAPGALVGALAILISEASREQAHQLLILAFELLGPDLQNAAAGKLFTAFGLALIKAQLPDDAMDVLTRFAIPIVAVHGDHTDHALALIYLALGAAQVGYHSLNRTALERAMATGDDRMRLTAFQLLAFQVLNLGDPSSAAQMYDELVALPCFSKASGMFRVNVRWSRLTAHVLAGDFNENTEARFEELSPEVRKILTAKDQVAFALDFAVLLRRLKKEPKARTVLEAELWNAVGLEDEEVQRKFVLQWDELGMPRDNRLEPLVSRLGCTAPQPHPLPILQKKAQSPTGREAGPKG